LNCKLFFLNKKKEASRVERKKAIGIKKAEAFLIMNNARIK
jgi:hypothetical protein